MRSVFTTLRGYEQTPPVDVSLNFTLASDRGRLLTLFRQKRSRFIRFLTNLGSGERRSKIEALWHSSSGHWTALTYKYM